MDVSSGSQRLGQASRDLMLSHGLWAPFPRGRGRQWYGPRNLILKAPNCWRPRHDSTSWLPHVAGAPGL